MMETEKRTGRDRIFRDRTLRALNNERDRQTQKWGVQNYTDEFWLVVLTEEVGEIARAIIERDAAGQVVEMTQAAAVIVAWLECLQRRAEGESDD